MNKKILIAIIAQTLCFIMLLQNTSPEYVQAWSAIYDSGDIDYAYDLAVDSKNNIIVTGTTYINNKWSYYTIKYDSNGIEKWHATYSEGWHNKAHAVAVDSNDNIIITGLTAINGSNNFATIKYDNDGNMIWKKIYDEGEDNAWGITVDNRDNIIVVGETVIEGCSYISIIKYSSDGNILWNITYRYGKYDKGRDVAIVEGDKIVVTGNYYNATSNNYDWITIKLDANGNIIWVITYNSGDNDYAFGITSDLENNIIVTGSSRVNGMLCYRTIKYNSNGEVSWNTIYKGDGDCISYDVTTDSNNNIWITGGYKRFGNWRYLTIEYDLYGNKQTELTFDDIYEDRSQGIKIDHDNKIVVTGYSKVNSFDYLTIKYNIPPIADFTYTPTNPSTQDVIHFNDTSVDPAGIIVNWSWDFGDGNISYKQNPTHRYGNDGIYTVILTVTDDDGTKNTTSKQINVTNTPPTANFTWYPKNATDVQPTQFTDQSTDIDGTIVNWTWDFGDGNISYEQNPTHTYTDNDTYNVTLTVIDDDGASDTITKQITVSNVAPVPDFNWTPEIPTTSDNVQFNDHSIDFDGTIISWHWGFGDGNTSTEQNPQHKYADNGSYTVTLTITDNDGAISTISKQITVANIPPMADFTWTPTNPTDLDTISFTDLSTDSDGAVDVWLWDFGDGSVSYDQNPQHKYADNGTYTVTLTIWDDDNASDTISKQITVANIPPMADFTWTPETPNQIIENVTFTSQSIDPDGTIINWTWNFGDGNTGYGEIVDHTYHSDKHTTNSKLHMDTRKSCSGNNCKFHFNIL